MSKTVLFLHGLGGSGADWNTVIPIFENKGWRCEAPTLFQHLRTRKNPPKSLDNVSILDWIKAASDYADQIFEEEGEMPAIVGHCIGGFIAQKLVELGQAKSAIFLSPLNFDQDKKQNSALPIASLLLRQSSQSARDKSKLCDVGLTLSVLNKVPAQDRRAILANMRYESTRLLNEVSRPSSELLEMIANLTKSDTPTLFIGCGKDRIVTSDMSHKASIAWTIRNQDTTFKNYDDIGHWPFAELNAKRMFSYIEDWSNKAVEHVQYKTA